MLFAHSQPDSGLSRRERIPKERLGKPLRIEFPGRMAQDGISQSVKSADTLPYRVMTITTLSKDF
jgi:hypothetical protein